MSSLAVTTTDEDSTWVVAIDGDIDLGADTPLLDGLSRVPTGVDRVTIDFARMGYMNSSGIASLVLLLTEATSRGIALSARGLSDHYRHIFDITQLTRLIDVEETAA